MILPDCRGGTGLTPHHHNISGPHVSQAPRLDQLHRRRRSHPCGRGTKGDRCISLHFHCPTVPSSFSSPAAADFHHKTGAAAGHFQLIRPSWVGEKAPGRKEGDGRRAERVSETGGTTFDGRAWVSVAANSITHSTSGPLKP